MPNTAERSRIRSRAVAWVVACAVAFSSMMAEANRFFRYEDGNGRLVMSHTIPNERVKFGYEIVDQHGRVIQKVSPQLSEEAYQAKVAKEKALAACETQLTRVRRQYQTPVDIDNAQEQALKSVDNRIANAKANLNYVQGQKQDLEGQAARLDLAGRSIGNALLHNIEKARITGFQGEHTTVIIELLS